MTELLLRDQFQDKLDQTFVIRNDIDGDGAEDTVELRLAECKALMPHEFPGKQRDPFSLLFKGPGAFVMPQGTYTLHHDAMGQVNLFLVPVGQEEGATLYQAVLT